MKRGKEEMRTITLAAVLTLLTVLPPLPVNQTRLQYQLLVMQQQVPAQWPLLAAVPQEPAQPVPAQWQQELTQSQPALRQVRLDCFVTYVFPPRLCGMYRRASRPPAVFRRERDWSLSHRRRDQGRCRW